MLKQVLAEHRVVKLVAAVLAERLGLEHRERVRVGDAPVGDREVLERAELNGGLRRVAVVVVDHRVDPVDVGL